ncbi:MAG TPA: GntR family transcriptional regulator [Pseudolysinimonas sp.]|nr:GntR family transcriptional regulator [Pseudolysinimonas sp.]
MRATENAYETLREDILSWRLSPGTALSEIDLADRLGVSRTPLRAALSRLALEGLLDTSVGTAGVVPAMSAENVNELFELREALETQAARLAARRRNPAAFAELAKEFDYLATTVAEDDLASYYRVVTRFDAAIDEAVHNPAFQSALDGMRTHLVRVRRIAADNPGRLLRAAEEHRLICEAIRDGDEALAASATSVHLRSSLKSILKVVEERAEATVAESPTHPDSES